MFDYFISLGWYCGTAASMSKYGLRSHSGPFDWYFSDLKGVLECMNNNFEDFLDKRNLEVMENEPKEFKDRKYGFYYNHEINTCFEDDFSEICNKYRRRIEVFKEMIVRSTCFIRTVRNEAEWRFIQNNRFYIDAVVKKYNPENEVIYVVSRKRVDIENPEFPFFTVEAAYDGSSYEALSSLFDDNLKLQKFCISSLEESRRTQNLYFNLQNKSCK